MRLFSRSLLAVSLGLAPAALALLAAFSEPGGPARATAAAVEPNKQAAPHSADATKAGIQTFFCHDSNTRRKIIIESRCPVPNADGQSWRHFDEEASRKAVAQADKGAIVSFLEGDKLISRLEFSCSGMTLSSLGLGLESSFERSERLKGSDPKAERAFSLLIAQEESNPGEVDYRYLNFQFTNRARKNIKARHVLKNWDDTYMNSDDPGVTCSH